MTSLPDLDCIRAVGTDPLRHPHRPHVRRPHGVLRRPIRRPGPPSTQRRGLSITDLLGHVTRFEYDAVGNLTAVIDPLGNRTTREYDGVSRLIRQLDALGQATTFGYDPLNRLESVLDALAGATRFASVNSRVIRAIFSLPECATGWGTVLREGLNPDRGGKESALSRGAKHDQIPEAAGAVQHTDRRARRV